MKLSTVLIALAVMLAATAAARAEVPLGPAAMSDEAKKAKAKACSTQADVRKLHGEARKAFREKCKRS